MNQLAKERIPIVFLAILALIAAVLAGLARLGIEVPTLFLNVTASHSVLMIYVKDIIIYFKIP